jgi:sulfoxide reductase heme-binding subunit YedZ
MKLKLLKLAVFLAALIPVAHLAYKGYAGLLGANPIEVITRATGDWTLRFLLITLLITPLPLMTTPTRL